MPDCCINYVGYLAGQLGFEWRVRGSGGEGGGLHVLQVLYVACPTSSAVPMTCSRPLADVGAYTPPSVSLPNEFVFGVSASSGGGGGAGQGSEG